MWRGRVLGAAVEEALRGPLYGWSCWIPRAACGGLTATPARGARVLPARAPTVTSVTGERNGAVRTLVVEDDTSLAQRLRRDLRRAGFAVDVVGNGGDAAFMGHEEPSGAVVLDLGLPQRSGLEVLRSWRY